VDGTLYVAGQVGRDLKGRPDPSEFESEVKNALDNAGLVLKAAGFGFEDAVAVQVYLTDMDLFPRMNACTPLTSKIRGRRGRRWVCLS